MLVLNNSYVYIELCFKQPYEVGPEMLPHYLIRLDLESHCMRKLLIIGEITSPGLEYEYIKAHSSN